MTGNETANLGAGEGMPERVLPDKRQNTLHLLLISINRISLLTALCLRRKLR